ncbi:MAG: hypothetical protein V4805_03240 [Pseudomonadota bacterium]
MNRIVRMLVTTVLALLLWPEFGRYRAEWMMAEANNQLDRVLRGVDRGTEAQHGIEQARNLAHLARLQLPTDSRAPLLEAVALILGRQGAAAIQVLDAAIAQGERPELTINLGRARGISGDEKGATAAFLRTAWANPGAISTLPAAMRAPLLDQVTSLEAELRAGRMMEPPPLN